MATKMDEYGIGHCGLAMAIKVMSELQKTRRLLRGGGQHDPDSSVLRAHGTRRPYLNSGDC